jgi:hypothetical protein
MVTVNGFLSKYVDLEDVIQGTQGSACYEDRVSKLKDRCIVKTGIRSIEIVSRTGKYIGVESGENRWIIQDDSNSFRSTLCKINERMYVGMYLDTMCNVKGLLKLEIDD